MKSPSEVSWKEEKSSAYLYMVMSLKEKGNRREKLFSELALAADSQAGLWELRIRKDEPTFDFSYSPSIKTKSKSGQKINTMKC